MNKQGTRLLVSVRNRDEALVALKSGVHLIDVKEPRKGSLGSAEPETIRDIVDAVAGARPVSAALGELNDLPPVASQFLTGLTFFKIGLAGCQADPDWPDRWIEACHELSRDSACPVAVVYADWETAHAPPPEEILGYTGAASAKVLLIDTFDKALPGLTQLWTIDRIGSLVDKAHVLAMEVVLAGKISTTDAIRLKETDTDFIAVRSAVCKPDRTGALDEELLRDLLDQLR